MARGAPPTRPRRTPPGQPPGPQKPAGGPRAMARQPRGRCGGIGRDVHWRYSGNPRAAHCSAVQ
eukprot:3649745-Lingulodinium_polyedra.AAC.1